MARRRRSEAPPADDSVPDWLWGEPMGRIAMRVLRDGKTWIDEVIAQRRAWEEKRDAWLEERGLVVYGMRSMSHQEYKRIEREEPHRILRRPEPPAA